MINSLRQLLLVSAGALSLVGCSTPQTALNLKPESGKSALSQAFPVGVADVRDAGETDVVVACRTDSKAAGTPAVQQTLHVHVLWQQSHVVKSGMRDVSQNATFRWFVTPAGSPDAGRPQMVEYTGTGLVEVARDGDRVVLRVREAHLTPGTVTADMADPVGPATLSGTIVARTDRAATVALLGDLQATLTAARPAGVAAEAKLPMGP